MPAAAAAVQCTRAIPHILRHRLLLLQLELISTIKFGSLGYA
jgi:hypothetical protein